MLENALRRSFGLRSFLLLLQQLKKQYTMIKANNPKLQSWLDIPESSDFPIQNIPFGIFKTKRQSQRVCTRIGDHVIDLAKLNELGFFEGLENITDISLKCL